jgi:hypothetical protein
MAGGEVQVAHSPASTAEVKNDRSYTTIPLVSLHGLNKGKFYTSLPYRLLIIQPFDDVS